MSPPPPLPSSPSRKRSLLKRKNPTGALAPLSPGKRNQLDDVASNTTSRVPLEVVYLNRYRRALRKHVVLSGWDPVDADLRLLVCGRDGADGRIESLSLEACAHVTNDGIRITLPVLQKLTMLNLRRCTALSGSLLKCLPTSLVEIDLSYCEWLDDHGVRTLASGCLALRRVVLTHCRRLTDYGVSAFADVSNSTGGSALTDLDMSLLPHVTDTCLLALLLRCHKLKRLCASRLPSMEGINLQGLPHNCAPSLESLDVSHNTKMHFLTVAHFVRMLSFGKLLELDMSHCAQVTNDTLVSLGRYTPSLRVLCVAFCTQLSDFGVQRLVEFVPLESDQHADFVDDDAAHQRCTRLTKLDVTGCYQITSVGIAAVARHCVGLTVLLVDGLRRLDATALSLLSANCATLHTLHWGGILIQSSGPVSTNQQAQTQTGFFSVPHVDRAACRAIGAMASLHTLHIGNTKCDVNALAQLCLPAIGSHLVDVDVSAIVTDVLCVALATHSGRSLRTLRLSRSRYFSETAFLQIATCCTQLRVLEMESCEQLQDRSLHALARHCAGSLEKLLVSNDWQITDRGVTFLAQHCLSLKRLQLRHCPEVSPQCLQEIARRNPLLVASSDGLTAKAAAVMAFVELEREMHDASRRLTRWLRDCLADRTHSASAIDKALRHLRKRRRCAVRIQRWIHRWISCKRHAELVASAKAARDKQVEAHWTWVAAYGVVCRLLRRHLRKWLVTKHQLAFQRAEKEKARRDHAATQVQRRYRGWQGREFAKQRRRQVAAWQAKRTESALTIQRLWRGFCGRRTTAARQRHAIERMVDKCWQMEREASAAMQISRTLRGFLGRRRRRHWVEYLQAQRVLREKSARQIQRALRAYWARVGIKRRLARGATALQRVFRGFAGRRVARHVVFTRAYVRAPCLLLLFEHTIYTRELAVAWKIKRDAGETIARALQCQYRGYYHGRLQRSLLLAAKRQDAFLCDSSARCLQHFFRSNVILHRLARLQAMLRLRKRSATTIQSVWRMWQGKVRATAESLRRDRKRHHAATLAILTAPSTQRQATRRLLQFGAIHLIIATYRQSLRSRGWQTPSFVKFLNRCAAKVQSLVRGHQTRQYVAWYKSSMTWAARMVQRVWRGKMGRKQWRAMVVARRHQQRLQEEQDRAVRVAQKLTGQYVLDMATKYDTHAQVLQQWVRTLQHRQVFKQARDAHEAALRVRATTKLGSVLTAATESVVFQARVWRECLDNKTKLNDMEDCEIHAIESEIATLMRACLDAYVAHATAASQYEELTKAKQHCVAVKKRLRDDATSMKETIQPFAEQAKQLTVESARVHVVNRQLQDELRRVKKSLTQFHEQLQSALPLLYERDVERLVTVMGGGLANASNGNKSLVDDQIERAMSVTSPSDLVPTGI